MIPPCPNKLRVKGEAPQLGTYTLSNAQLASQTMIPPCPNKLRVKGEAPQLGTYALSNAQLASQKMIPPCPNKLRVKGEAPKLGTYTLSNAQLALSCGGESEGRAPPIGRSCTLESQIGLSHNESARRAPPIGRSCTCERPDWPSRVVVRAKGEPPQLGGHAPSKAKLASHTTRARGEPPQLGGHALTNGPIGPLMYL
jgi:hypothetical protein